MSSWTFYSISNQNDSVFYDFHDMETDLYLRAIDDDCDGAADRALYSTSDGFYPAESWDCGDSMLLAQIINSADEQLNQAPWKLIWGSSNVNGNDTFWFSYDADGKTMSLDLVDKGGDGTVDGLQLTTRGELFKDHSRDLVGTPLGDRLLIAAHTYIEAVLKQASQKSTQDFESDPQMPEVYSADLDTPLRGQVETRWKYDDGYESYNYSINPPKSSLFFEVHQHDDTSVFWTDTGIAFGEEYETYGFFELHAGSHFLTECDDSKNWQRILSSMPRVSGSIEPEIKTCETLSAAIEEDSARAQSPLLAPLASQCPDLGLSAIPEAQAWYSDYLAEARISYASARESLSPFPQDHILYERDHPQEIESVLVLSANTYKRLENGFLRGDSLEHLISTGRYDAIYLLDDYFTGLRARDQGHYGEATTSANLSHLAQYLFAKGIHPIELSLHAHGSIDKENESYGTPNPDVPLEKNKPVMIDMALSSSDFFIHEDKSLPAFPTERLRFLRISSCLMTDTMADHIAEEWHFTGELLCGAFRENGATYVDFENTRFPFEKASHLSREYNDPVDVAIFAAFAPASTDGLRAIVYSDGQNVTRALGLPNVPASDSVSR